MAPRPPVVRDFQQGGDLEDLEHVTENFWGEKANHAVNAQNKNRNYSTRAKWAGGQDLDDFLGVRDVKRICPKRREAYLTSRVVTEETTISILAESACVITNS